MPDRNGRLTDFEKNVYRRNIDIPEVGEAGQLKLLKSRVLIIGLGGLGSSAVLYLAACGIGELGIADSDRVELSNLQRQILHGRGDIGSEKTASAERTVRRIRPSMRLNLHPFRITLQNASKVLARYDFIIEATDNFESKFLINDTCVRMGKPFSHAGILGTFGQTMTVIPGQGPCFRCVFEDMPDPSSIETTEEAGVLGCTAGVLGVIQAAEAIKYLIGRGELLTGRLLTCDTLTMTFREVRLPLKNCCEICLLQQTNQSGGSKRNG